MISRGDHMGNGGGDQRRIIRRQQSIKGGGGSCRKFTAREGWVIRIL